MKKIFAFTSIVATCCFYACAQDVNEYGAHTIVIEDISKQMSKGAQPCIKADIYQANKQNGGEAWKKAVRKETKSKVMLLGNEYSIAGTKLKEVSAKPLNVYAIINEYPEYVEMNVCFEQDSAFLAKETKETEYLAARMFVRNFAAAQYRAAVKEQIDAEEDKLKQMEKGISKLTKSNDNLHKSINSTARKIEAQSRKITTSEQDQQRIRNVIRIKKDELQKFRNANASEAVLKDAEKKLKASEKELKSFEKQEDKMHKAVEKEEAAIRDLERKISDNEMTTEIQRNEITAQKNLIYSLQKKLEGIR